MTQDEIVTEAKMERDREFVNRLKADPSNVAAQLMALTQITDWARVQHRSNFDHYLVAAAELLAMSTAQDPALDDDALINTMCEAFIEGLKPALEKQYPDSTDTGKGWADASNDEREIVRGGMRAALDRLQAKAPETGE